MSNPFFKNQNPPQSPRPSAQVASPDPLTDAEINSALDELDFHVPDFSKTKFGNAMNAAKHYDSGPVVIPEEGIDINLDLPYNEFEPFAYSVPEAKEIHIEPQITIEEPKPTPIPQPEIKPEVIKEERPTPPQVPQTSLPQFTPDSPQRNRYGVRPNEPPKRRLNSPPRDNTSDHPEPTPSPPSEADKKPTLLSRISSRPKTPALPPKSSPRGTADEIDPIDFGTSEQDKAYDHDPLIIPETNFDLVELGPGYFSFSILTTINLILTNSEVVAYLINVQMPRGGSKYILRQYSEIKELYEQITIAKISPNLPKLPKLPASLTSSSPAIHLLHSSSQLRHFLHTLFATNVAELEKHYAVLNFLEEPRAQPSSNPFIIARGFIEHRCKEAINTLTICESILSNISSIQQFFTQITTLADWPRATIIAKNILEVEQVLESRPTESKYTPQSVSPASFRDVTDPNIANLRLLMSLALAEIGSKIRCLIAAFISSRLTEQEIENMKLLIREAQERFSFNLCGHANGWVAQCGTGDLSIARWPSYLRENCPWYNDFFFNNTHSNLVAHDPAGENSYVVSLLYVAGEDGREPYFRGIGRCRDGFKKVISVALPEQSPERWERNTNILRNVLLQMYPGIKTIPGVELSLCTNPDFELELLKIEPKDMKVTPKFKFGVLYCAPGQTIEEEMFSNEHGSEAFNHFLELMGDRVALSGFPRFNGGLDVRGDNSTGVESVFTTFKGHDIMYHVAPLLPYSPGNTQQLHKKRHLGNDIVMIVFQDAGCEPYTPNCVKSQFIQIVIVVRVIPTPAPSPNDPTPDPKQVYYQVTVAHQSELPPFGPPLQIPSIFSHSPYFRSWLLSKMINGELAAYRSAVFHQRHKEAYKATVEDLIVKFEKSGEKKKPIGSTRITTTLSTKGAVVGGLVSKQLRQITK